MKETLYRRISMNNKEFVIKAMLLITLGILLFVFVMCLSRLEFYSNYDCTCSNGNQSSLDKYRREINET